jgi:hypothetical protein
VTAGSFNLAAVEDPCEDDTTVAPTSTFWKVGDRIPIEQPMLPRQRTGIRSDIVIILVLALLIAGGGAYSAFRDWGAPASDPTAAGVELARADVGATGALNPGTAGGATDAVANAPAPLLGEMLPLVGEQAPAANPALAEAPRVPQGPQPGVVTVETITIPLDNAQIANAGAAQAGQAPTAQPGVPANAAAPADDPVLAYAPTEPAAAGPFEAAAPPLAAPPRPRQEQAAAPPNNPNPATGTVSATARTWVNMRAGPDNEAAVITVVGQGDRVQVVACNYWCEVVYNGQTGWIYQDFLAGAPRNR